MKTAEELKELKTEVETLGKKLTELSGEELSHVAGGAADITFAQIMAYIDEGNDYYARDYFELAQYTLAPLEAYLIRMAFWNKFGYPIDKFGG